MAVYSFQLLFSQYIIAVCSINFNALLTTVFSIEHMNIFMNNNLQIYEKGHIWKIPIFLLD